MPHVPNLLERLYILRANRAPGSLYDLLGGWTCKAVVLAANVDLFDALADEPATVPDLADRLDCHPGTLEMLCEFLARADYLDESGGEYHLSPLSDRWLVGDDSLLDWFVFWNDVVYPFWDATAEGVLRTGEPGQTLYAWLDDHPELWPATQRGFEATAVVTIDPIIDAVSLHDGDRILDVGGGHGRYAIAACERTPGATATIVDDPLALDVARENVAAAGLEDRIDVRGVDVLEDVLGSDDSVDGLGGDDSVDGLGSDGVDDHPGDGYDVAFCFNLVHGFTNAENERLFANVADALAPGGRVVVVDQLADTTGPIATARATIAFIGLAYRVLLGGRVYPYDDVTDWLETAGFQDPARTDFRRAPGVSMITATLD